MSNVKPVLDGTHHLALLVGRHDGRKRKVRTNATCQSKSPKNRKKRQKKKKKPPLCLRVDGMIEAIPDFFRSASIKVGIGRGSAARAKRMPSR